MWLAHIRGLIIWKNRKKLSKNHFYNHWKIVLVKTCKVDEELTLTKGLILSALTFIVMSLIGSISFMFFFKGQFVNALFESVSGYTTTGLSVFDSVANVPKSLLLWRSLTQWLGGIGIITFFLFIFPTFPNIHPLYTTMKLSQPFP